MVNSASKRQLVLRADNFVTLMCQLSGNLGASTSWNPQGFFQTCTGIVIILCRMQWIVCGYN